MIQQKDLIERIKAYDESADGVVIEKAYAFAMKAHEAQTRASGEAYFSHPAEVASILVDLKLDVETIATALLHDTVEDTSSTLNEIRKIFGENIANLVDGVTKLNQLELKSIRSKQAENFRKLVLAMSKDIRVLLVKLADRLHNMRTLHYISKREKRVRIAHETLDIYAPLSQRIGMHKIKDELEDLAFAQVNPEARKTIIDRLSYLRGANEDGIVFKITRQLKDLLNENNINDVDIMGREKAPFSIWKKIQEKNITFEQLSDVMAFRILVDDLQHCYHVLGVLHGNFHVIPGRFKDYISNPKPNGYRSIHTGLLGPERRKIEVQIRTRDMHEIAELGVAAHWAYKQGQPKTDGEHYCWLRELLDIMEHAHKADEFLENTKLELFRDQVFCFSPKGDLVALPFGSTPIDFAYAVHSEIGDHTIGAKINGRMLPLRTKLANGDQVEVITAKTQTPSPTWERFVVTGKARARIRRFIRNQKRNQYLQLGRAILQKSVRAYTNSFGDKLFDKNILTIFQAASVEDLYVNIGAGTISAVEVCHEVFPDSRQESTVVKEGAPLDLKAPKKKRKQKEASIPIKGLIPGMAIHYAGCCHPLPGDSIVGIITTGRGITIHTRDCDNLANFEDEPERWIEVGWDDGQTDIDQQAGRLMLVIANKAGALGKISTIIGQNGGNISNLKIQNRTNEYFELTVDVYVKNVSHLSALIAALRASPYIFSVDRNYRR